MTNIDVATMFAAKEKQECEIMTKIQAAITKDESEENVNTYAIGLSETRPVSPIVDNHYLLADHNNHLLGITSFNHLESIGIKSNHVPDEFHNQSAYSALNMTFNEDVKKVRFMYEIRLSNILNKYI